MSTKNEHEKFPVTVVIVGLALLAAAVVATVTVLTREADGARCAERCTPYAGEIRHDICYCDERLLDSKER